MGEAYREMKDLSEQTRTRSKKNLVTVVRELCQMTMLEESCTMAALGRGWIDWGRLRSWGEQKLKNIKESCRM